MAHAPGRSHRRPFHLVAAAAYLVLLAALGGASRGDELQQVAVSAFSLVAIAVALWPLDSTSLREARGLLAGLAFAYALLLVQLIPLPPALWGQLPGHPIYAAVADAVGSSGWRPLSLSPDLTLNALSGLLPATALGLLALHVDFKGRLRLAEAVVGIACVSALLALVQAAAGGTTLHLFRTTSADSAVGLFANRNHQAAFMAISLPLAAAAAMIELRDGARPQRVVTAGLAAGVLMLLALAAAGSRMGLLLGAVGVASAAAICWLCGERPRLGFVTGRVWAAIGAATLAAVTPVGLLIAHSGAVQRLASADRVDETRIAALPSMLEAARAFMPLGAGFGTFEVVYQRFEPDALLSTIYLNQAHNEPVQLAIEGGAPALVLLFAFLLWWVRSASRALRPRESASRRAMGIAAASVTSMLMLSSLVDYPLRTPLLSALFAMCCVELVRSAHKRGRAAPPGQVRG